MGSITMITDMSSFGAEPPICATLLPNHARFWSHDAAILDLPPASGDFVEGWIAQSSRQDVLQIIPVICRMTILFKLSRYFIS